MTELDIIYYKKINTILTIIPVYLHEMRLLQGYQLSLGMKEVHINKNCFQGLLMEKRLGTAILEDENCCLNVSRKTN